MGFQYAALSVVLCVGCLTGVAFGDFCETDKKPVCIKTMKPPYYEHVCTDVACTKIEVPCGPPDDRFSCAFDEICVKYRKPCFNETDFDDFSECLPQHKCEWRPYWEIDRALFAVECTEYYTLMKKETCGDAMAKFYLPWKVFHGFNPEVNCKTVKAGDKVCIHASVEPKRPACGKGRCKVGERCSYTNCYWKPRYGERCGSVRCPVGYACRHELQTGCKTTPTTFGTFYFDLNSFTSSGPFSG